ncbi:MAG TPA: RimK family alpha-L-glutamate ligase [Gemmataceae bacterium]|jgi:RimK family alpha-L-glutamate ligase|nr:RimK family alpha-L-glutamate ligase [Gemmataceae bacterium]
MRIALLAGGDGWHVRDLARAAGELGHTTDVLDFRTLRSGVGIQFDSFAGFDAILVRTMPAGSLEQIVFRMDVLHRAQARGIRVLNPPAALEACVDKYLATAKLAAAGLPVPPTVACQDAESALAAFRDLGGDVVVKPLFGAEGRGLMRVSDPELAWRTFRTLERSQAVLYVQQFVRHPGWDLRVFVLGGGVLAAMRRYARDGWRTNVALGGRAESVTVNADEGRLALASAKAVGAEVAGVDLLSGPDGEWYVLEVNAVPGWRALAPTCNVDVAAAVISYLTAGDRHA